MITITPAANAELTRLLARRSGDKLRLSLEDSACEQFYYHFEAIAEPVTEDLVITLGGLTVAIDPRHQQYLQNLQIDFAQDLMGGGFRFQNPAATKICPCGNAFTAQLESAVEPAAAFEI
jgi:iron-sulfur cluster assembly protein